MQSSVFRLTRIIFVFLFLSGEAHLFGQERSLVIVPKERKHALLIGVNSYSRPIRSLNYCVSDMKLLAASLEKIGFPKENIILMTDDSLKSDYRPTKTNIEKQFENLLGTVLEEDLIFIAFSGHGASNAGESFLCPGDTNPNRPDTMISRQWLTQQLEESPSQHRIFLVDACRNEIFSSGAKSVSGTKSLETEWGDLPGVYQLSSCSPKQQSWEDPALKQGVFTHFFVTGMSDSFCDVNKDGNIDLLELFNYTRDKTIQHVRSTFNEPQRPTFKLSGELSAPIVLASIDVKPTVIDVKPTVIETKPTVIDVPVVKEKERFSDGVMPKVIDLANPEELIAPLRELKQDNIKPVVDTARHSALVFFADAARDEKLYAQATKDFFACLVPNFRKGNDRIEWVEEIFPIMVRRQNFDGLKGCIDDIVTDMVKPSNQNDKADWVRNCASLVGFALAEGDGVTAKDRTDAANYSSHQVVTLAAAVANKRMMVKDYKILVDNFPMVDYSVSTGLIASQRVAREALASTREIRWGDRLSLPDEISSPNAHAFRATVVWLAKYGKKEEYYKFLATANKTYGTNSLSIWAWYFAKAEAILGDFDRARNHWMQYPTSGTGPSSHILLSLIVRQEFLAGEFKGWETMQHGKNNIENLRGFVYNGLDMSGYVSLFHFDYGRGMARHKTEQEIQSECVTLLSEFNDDDRTFFMAGIATGLQDHKNPVVAIDAPAEQMEDEKLADEVDQLIGEINVKMNLRHSINQDGTLAILTYSSRNGLRPYTGNNHITSFPLKEYSSDGSDPLRDYPGGPQKEFLRGTGYIAVTVTPAMIGEFTKGMEYYAKEDMPNAKRCLEKVWTMFTAELERTLRAGKSTTRGAMR